MFTLTERWHLARGLPLEGNEMKEDDEDWKAIQAMSDAELDAELRASGATPEAVAPMLLAKVSARLGHDDLPHIRRMAELLAGGMRVQQDAVKWAGETLLELCSRLEVASGDRCPSGHPQPDGPNSTPADDDRWRDWVCVECGAEWGGHLA